MQGARFVGGALELGMIDYPADRENGLRTHTGYERFPWDQAIIIKRDFFRNNGSGNSSHGGC